MATVSTNNDADTNEWTVVHRNSAKKKRTSKTTRTRKSNSNNNTIEKNYFDDNNNHDTTKTYIEDLDTLHKCLLQCMDYVVRTDLFRCSFHEAWNNNMKQQIELLSSSSSTDSEFVSIISVPEIVCYGIGNFSVTSLEHYSASLWQLAFVLCLRNLFNNLNDENRNKEPKREEVTMTAETSSGIVISNPIKNSDDNLNNNIPIIYYDPITTASERRFLQEYIPNCIVLESNERGNRVINHDPELYHNDQRIIIIPTTIFFMPHCPCALYENVIWSNWDHIVIRNTNNEVIQSADDKSNTESKISSNSYQHYNLIIIGNSSRSLADQLIVEQQPPSDDTNTTTTSSNRKCMQALLPWLQETPLQVSKNDIKEFPGNIQGAFNDTYLYYWDTTKNDSTITPLPLCPYDNLNDNLNDNNNDLELI